MRRFAVVLSTATLMALSPALVSAPAGAASGDGQGAHESPHAAARPPGWSQRVPFREQVVSSPTPGGGYPGVKPAPGGCVNGSCACIGVTLQTYRDHGGRLVRTSRNVLVSRHLWDPYQPGRTRGGLPQRACEDPTFTCEDIFVGDYFSMQVSRTRVYLLTTSTHPRSRVRGDDGRRLHYQQQLLTTVKRRDLGL